MPRLERPTFEAKWWPVLLETMPGSSESITIAVIVRAQSGQSQARQAIAPAALAAMFGPARQGMSILVAETVLGLQSQLDDGIPVEDTIPAFEGVSLGNSREATAQDLNEVFDLAFRLCSAFSHSHFGVSEPADPSREVAAAFDEWAEKIRDELARQNTARGVIDAFNIKLKVAERKSMRVGFYYSGFAANFGVLRPGHRAYADTRALKVKIFDLEYIRRHHGLVTQSLALIVGVANANQLQIYSRQEVQTLRESVGYIESEARARQVDFQQYETPTGAADHMRSSLQLPDSALAY